MIKFLSVVFCALLFFSCSSDNETSPSSASESSSSSETAKSSSSVKQSKSSSSVVRSSSSELPQSEDTFKDSRDSETYELVKMDTQTWMARNLNYDADGSKCYNNSDANCDKYGRLYDWETAKTACPSGWHLPTRDEWKKIIDNSGAGKNLKTRTWGGIDKYGFAALPGGYGDGNDFSLEGRQGLWWTSSSESANYPYSVYMSNADDEAEVSSDDHKSNFLSVRCLKN